VTWDDIFRAVRTLLLASEYGGTWKNTELSDGGGGGEITLFTSPPVVVNNGGGSYTVYTTMGQAYYSNKGNYSGGIETVIFEFNKASVNVSSANASGTVDLSRFGKDFIFDNNNTIGLGLEIFESGTSEAIEEVIKNKAFYSLASKIGTKVIGGAIIGLNLFVTGYTISNEIQGKNGAQVNTHTWVNGGVTILTTVATGIGIFFAGATAPAWVPVVAIGGAALGLGYGIAQVAGVDGWIDTNFGYK